MTNKRGAWVAKNRDLYSGLIRLHVLHHAAEGPIFGLGMMEELHRHGYPITPGPHFRLLENLGCPAAQSQRFFRYSSVFLYSSTRLAISSISPRSSLLMSRAGFTVILAAVSSRRIYCSSVSILSGSALVSNGRRLLVKMVNPF